MKLPEWLPALGVREEKIRAANGLIPKKDGWYKTFDGRTSYICKPCPVAEAVAILPNRIKAIRQKRAGSASVVPVTTGLITLDSLFDSYQAWLYQRLTTGVPRKLARRTYDDAVAEVSGFVEVAGGEKIADSIGPAEFSAYALERLAGIAPSSVRRKMIYIEAFANWAAPGSRKAGLLSRPWQYGADFRKPSTDEITTSAADSDKAYTPEQLKKAFAAVKKNPRMLAAGWLGLCGAFGPKDLGLLPESMVDLGASLIRFPRGKTGVGRLCWLTPAAKAALKRYLAVRAAPKPGAEALLFRTDDGRPCYRGAEGVDVAYRVDNIGRTWSETTGLPFSGLRSTFATIADDYPDQRAVDIVLGHKSGHKTQSIRNKHYAKKFNPERVQRLVCAVVPLAFGRKTPSSVLSAPAMIPVEYHKSDDGFGARPQRQPGRSSSAESRRPANAHRKREVRQT